LVCIQFLIGDNHPEQFHPTQVNMQFLIGDTLNHQNNFHLKQVQADKA